MRGQAVESPTVWEEGKIGKKGVGVEPRGA